MVYLVFIEPEVFLKATMDGPYAIPCVINLLKGAIQNCLICDFKSYAYLSESIRNNVDEMPATYSRTVIKKLLMTLKKRNRFVDCLEYDFTSAHKTELQMLIDNNKNVPVDFALVVESQCDKLEIPHSTLPEYCSTEFEIRRSEVASDGIVCAPGEADVNNFLSRSFHKAFYYTSQIEILDKLLGNKYGANYKYTMKEFMRWFKAISKINEKIDITIICGEPSGVGRECRPIYFVQEMKAIRDSEMAGAALKINFYVGIDDSQPMAHARFIITSQFCFKIDRGMDFLDPSTKRNRDVTISLASIEETHRLISKYTSFRKPSIYL
jgi:hypothetical protein